MNKIDTMRYLLEKGAEPNLQNKVIFPINFEYLNFNPSE